MRVDVAVDGYIRAQLCGPIIGNDAYGLHMRIRIGMPNFMYKLLNV